MFMPPPPLPLGHWWEKIIGPQHNTLSKRPEKKKVFPQIFYFYFTNFLDLNVPKNIFGPPLAPWGGIFLKFCLRRNPWGGSDKKSTKAAFVLVLGRGRAHETHVGGVGEQEHKKKKKNILLWNKTNPFGLRAPKFFKWGRVNPVVCLPPPRSLWGCPFIQGPLSFLC